MQYTFFIQADHWQFYLEDRTISHDTGDLWGCQADSLLQALDGLLAVGTARWGKNTPVTVMVHQQRPPDCEDCVCETVREGTLRTISGWLHL